jgi:hypothetical protein
LIKQLGASVHSSLDRQDKFAQGDSRILGHGLLFAKMHDRLRDGRRLGGKSKEFPRIALKPITDFGKSLKIGQVAILDSRQSCGTNPDFRSGASDPPVAPLSNYKTAKVVNR